LDTPEVGDLHLPEYLNICNSLIFYTIVKQVNVTDTDQISICFLQVYKAYLLTCKEAGEIL